MRISLWQLSSLLTCVKALLRRVYQVPVLKQRLVCRRNGVESPYQSGRAGQADNLAIDAPKTFCRRLPFVYSV
jgi:hypothetical protein